MALGRTLVAGLAVASFVGPGCLWSPTPWSSRGTLAKWESKLGIRRPAERGLADLVKGGALTEGPNKLPVCLKDRVSPEAIRAQWQRWEAQTMDVEGGKRETGAVRGVDLGTLPGPQGKFLKAQDRWLGKDAPGSCAEPFCLLGQHYSPAKPLLGEIAYGFRLRMGYLLSMRDEVPVAGGGSLGFNPHPEFSNFLFSEAEMRAFWKLGLTLPESFRQLRSLNTFHRVPSGFKPPGWGASTCADAVGTQSRGFIRLSDNCLELEEGGGSGFFYEAVAHEIAHRLDHALGPRLGDQLSVTDGEWLKINDWKKETVVDERTGSVQDGWVSKEELDGFVRTYAGKSPTEAFADTAAYLRYDPDHAWKASPKKALYLQKKIFGGRSYLAAGRRETYLATIKTRVAPALAAVAQRCVVDIQSTLSGGASETPSPEARALSWTVPLSPTMQACLGLELDRGFGVQVEELKGEEWEACDDLTGANLAKIRKEVFEALRPELDRLIQDKASLAPVLRAAKDLRQSLADAVDSREAYLHCTRSTAPDACYQQSLEQAFTAVAAPYAATLTGTAVEGSDLLTRERDLFFSRHSREEAAVQVMSFFKFLLAGIDKPLSEAAAARFGECRGAQALSGSDGAPPLTLPFTGGTLFVERSILDCINQSARRDVEGAVDRYLKRLGVGINDEDARAFVEPLVMSPFLMSLQEFAAAAAAEEDQARQTRKVGVIDVLVSQVLARPSWSDQAESVARAAASCQVQAEHAFDAYFEKVGASERLPARFEAIENVRAQWGREACQKAVANAKVVEGIKTRQAALWKEALLELEALASTRVDAAIAGCKKANPGLPVLVKKKWRDCLTRAMPGIEAAALEAWLLTPKGRLLENRKSDAQKHLELRRPTFLLKL